LARHQDVRLLVHGRRTSEDTCNFGIVNHVGQAVRAHQIPVADLDLVLVQIEHDRVLDAQRTGDQVLDRRPDRLLLRDQAGVDLLLQQRMVLGDLR
jgi:hypothetical protein